MLSQVTICSALHIFCLGIFWKAKLRLASPAMIKYHFSIPFALFLCDFAIGMATVRFATNALRMQVLDSTSSKLLHHHHHHNLLQNLVNKVHRSPCSELYGRVRPDRCYFCKYCTENIRSAVIGSLLQNTLQQCLHPRVDHCFPLCFTRGPTKIMFPESWFRFQSV